jgi:DNA-binding Lrp family transcriptional regulator
MDALDRHLLVALQDNGARTNQQLAETVGLSPSQISRRRQALEADGLITGYGARLSAEKLGFGIRVFVHITLATHSPDNSRRFADLVARTPEIQEAHSPAARERRSGPLRDRAGDAEGEPGAAALKIPARSLLSRHAADT